MPPLSQWAIRAALLYFLVGLTLGMLMLANKGTPIDPSLWRLMPAHVEFLLLGWVAQLGLAVAHWIVPRFRGGDYGRLRVAWFSVVLLNAGVLLVGGGTALGAPNWVSLVGRLLEGGAAVTFAIYIWPRVRPLGSG